MIGAIKEYWAQISLILMIVIGGIGFILRLYFNWSIKKKEITFNKVRDTKVEELRAFYRSFIDLESNLRSLLHAAGQQRVEEETALRKQLPTKWLEFKYSIQFLKLFLEPKEKEICEKLDAELNEVHKQIDFYCIDRAHGAIDQDTIKAFRKVRDEIFPNNIPALINELEKNFRLDFGIE